MRIDDIKIGERVRKDMGDIKSLSESMKRHGLLHPVVVKADGMLIAGHRRIEAARLLGWNEIHVTEIEIADLLSAERDENSERKDFAPTEAVEIGRLIEEQERPKAEQRQRQGSARGGARAGSVDSTETGSVRDLAAKAVGMGSPKYDQAKKIVAAAEADPENFGDLPSQMDESGNVNGTYREMQRRAGKKSKSHRHPAFKKMGYPKPNREIQRSVWALDGICDVLKNLPIDQLDASKTKEWSLALKKSAAIIAKTARRLSHVKAN